MWNAVKFLAVGAISMVRKGAEHIGFYAAAGFTAAAIVSVAIPGPVGIITSVLGCCAVISILWMVGVGTSIMETVRFIQEMVDHAKEMANQMKGFT